MEISELDLLKVQKAAVFLAIAADVLLLISANQGEQEIIEKQLGDGRPFFSEATKSAATAATISLVVSIISAILTVLRLNQRITSQQQGKSNGSLSSTMYITAGSLISVIAGILVTKGALQRAQEPQARITII